MKAFHGIFEKVIALENLVTSWREFRIGKKKRRDTLSFERNLEDNLWELREALLEKTYHHGGYESFYVHDPKLRHIHKASVRDRVLHHAIVKYLNPMFEPTFIPDSYSCRINKGAHKGIERFLIYARKVSRNFTGPCWIVKCDVKKFFASVDHRILRSILFKRIHDPNMRWLLDGVIESFESDRTRDPTEPKGLPIGNLTSQLFANVYLNELDQFMKHTLKQKYYIRYADDFVVLQSQRDQCEKIVECVRSFLWDSLKLELHPSKILVRKFSQGIDFLGYTCFPHFRLPRLATEKRIFRKLHEKAKLLKEGAVTEDSFYQTVQSYWGILSHSNSFRTRQDLENQIFFWLTE